MKGRRRIVDRRAEAAKGFAARVIVGQTVGDEIIDTLGEKGTQLVVRVRLDLCVRAQRKTKESPNAVTKKSRAHGVSAPLSDAP